jgi:hypothetical protein
VSGLSFFALQRGAKERFCMRSILLIVGILIATAGGVITYRALYVEPKSAVVITETEVRELPNQARVVGGALMFVGGSALALFAALRKVR